MSDVWWPHRHRREPGPASERVDLTGVLIRLDAAVDRLEGVHEQWAKALRPPDQPVPPESEDTGGGT